MHNTHSHQSCCEPIIGGLRYDAATRSATPLCTIRYLPRSFSRLGCRPLRHVPSCLAAALIPCPLQLCTSSFWPAASESTLPYFDVSFLTAFYDWVVAPPRESPSNLAGALIPCPLQLFGRAVLCPLRQILFCLAKTQIPYPSQLWTSSFAPSAPDPVLL